MIDAGLRNLYYIVLYCSREVLKPFNYVLSAKVLQPLNKLEPNSESCDLKCQNISTSLPNSFPQIVPIFRKFYFTSTNIFFCTIGGIISLFLGFSLLDGSFSLMFTILKNIKHLANLNKKFITFLKFAIIFCSFIASFIFCVLQLLFYIYENPIINISNSVSIQDIELPYLTICFPEIKSLLIKQSKNDTKTTEQEINNLILSTLNCLLDPQYENLVIERSSSTPHLGLCFTCKPKLKSSNKPVNSTSFQPYHIVLKLKKLFNIKYNECFAFFHLANEIPVLDKDPQVYVDLYSLIKIYSITTVSGVGAETVPPYDQCYNSCLYNKLKPYKNLLTTTLSKTSYNFSLDLARNCRLNCVNSKFSAWTFEEIFSPEKIYSKSCVSVKILLEQNELTYIEFDVTPNYIITIEEHKSYTFIQLINDIGGVIGFVLGASLLSVGNMAINLFFK